MVVKARVVCGETKAHSATPMKMRLPADVKLERRRIIRPDDPAMSSDVSLSAILTSLGMVLKR